jgi:hypothetical protein
MLVKLISSLTVRALVPKLVESILERVYGESKAEVPTPNRKSYDTHVFTEHQVETIKYHERTRIKENLNKSRNNHVTQQQTVTQLNELFGLNKSVSTYRKVWKNLD